MAHHESVLAELKAAGIRLTPQRLLVLQTIAEAPGHASVEDIHRRAKRSYPYLDVATVYRTVQLLKRLNVVTEIGIGHRLHYEMAAEGARHHHMVCDECGGAYDLAPRQLEALRERLEHEFGFRANLDHFTVTGVCAACVRRAG